MLVAELIGQREFRLTEQPIDPPGPGEVQVRVGGVGICGSDVHYYRHGRIAEHVVREPLVLGHEASGRVVAVGDGIDPGRIGERVALEPGIPCRRCRECKTGHYNLCPDVRFFATPPVDGAFAEYVTIAADFAHPVPDNLSDDAAALIEPLSVAVWACGKAGVTAGSRVLITGAGPIGLVMAQVARALGATDVIVSDIAPARLEAALRLGATQVLDARSQAPADQGVEADALIDCSGAQVAVSAGIRAVRRAGRVILVGMGADEVTLPVGLIQGRELTVTGTFRYANTYPTAIAMAAAGLVDLDAMVTAHFGLADVATALAQEADPNALKTVIVP